jgi:flagellar biosynthetic protein FliO
MWLLLQASTSAARELPGGYGASLLQSLLALAAVCILAWVVLRWSAQRGLGTGAGQRVQVIERVPLDARRWVYLVKIGERVLVLGAGDGASPTLLTELAAKDLPDAPRTRSFLEVLRNARPDDAREGSAGTREGSAAAREGSATAREGSATAREGSATAREGSAAARESSAAANESSAGDGSTGTREGSVS